MDEMGTGIDVDAAARRLHGVAHRTPVLTSTTLDERAGGQVFVKAENLQRSGAFKFRGAYNKLASLDPGTRAKGVVAFSSGNHAGAVALAAKLFGIRAVILMPTDAPEAKVAATEGYGAEVVTFDRFADDREALARALTEERGLTLVPPYDDPFVIAGQGTAARELLEDVPDLDVIVVPVGGGGLAAGTCIAAAAATGVKVVGVEPAAGDDTLRSLVAGERVAIAVPQTIADGQAVATPGALTFPINQRHLERIDLVTDDELVDAMRFCFDRMKLVAEPSGVCAIAALLQGKVGYGRVGVILSGGNVGAARFAELLGRDVERQ
ncbi:MAG: threo-3-hydroxy-L-aspartate ammonia-lyase [Actinomycetota bacterium]|jgi:threonine dehydratase|nr:threo-3-hydroxy-L-aspartate ammonia-lyase [Actinomycetota bacterium]